MSTSATSELNDAGPRDDEITMSITSMDFKVASLAKLLPRTIGKSQR
jgi:hypothetical protein